jgi:site-specific recombinase XerD
MALPPNSLTAFAGYIKATRSGPTARRYVIAVRMFLNWYSGFNAPLERASLDTLSRYSLTLLEANYRSTTIRAHLAGIAKFLRWLREKHKISVPQFHDPELPAVKREVKDTLQQDALSEFFRSAAGLDEPTRTAALLLPCSGLRCGEMVALPLACLKRQRLTLDGKPKDVLMLRVVGKGGHERVVPLLDEGATLLVEYLKGWRRVHRDTKWLFPGRSGHMATRTLRKAVQEIRQPSGLSYTPHSMRRTYLTTLYRQGVEPTILAKIAGHGNVQVLVNHYLGLDSRDLANAVHSKGGSLMKGTPP